MTEELARIEERPISDMTVSRPPEVVLDEAKKAAQALKNIVSQKAKPVVFGGEQYLEFEDLQTLGRFYGVTAKVISTSFVEYGDVKGFEAKAVALRADGMEISAAEAMCLNDERNWKDKPLFQLRSMAQTRACAKTLRNCLAWVVVLAGYKPTPAEEMTEPKPPQPPQKPQPQTQGNAEDKITPAQVKLIYARLKNAKVTEDDFKLHFDIEHIADLPKSRINEALTSIDSGELAF